MSISWRQIRVDYNFVSNSSLRKIVQPKRHILHKFFEDNKNVKVVIWFDLRERKSIKASDIKFQILTKKKLIHSLLLISFLIVWFYRGSSSNNEIGKNKFK
jgi:hypothetical protein